MVSKAQVIEILFPFVQFSLVKLNAAWGGWLGEEYTYAGHCIEMTTSNNMLKMTI